MKLEVVLPDQSETVRFLADAADRLGLVKFEIAHVISERMRDVARHEIVRLHAVDTGKLYGGVESVVKTLPSSANERVLGKVVSRGTHARVVANGRRVGTMPRFTSAARVAKRKRIKRALGTSAVGDVGALIGSKITPKFRAWAGRNLPPMNEAQLRRAAFLIARKIKRQGIDGKDYLEAAHKTGISGAPEVFEQVVADFKEWAG